MLGNSYTYFNNGINRQLQFLLNSADNHSGQVEALVGAGLNLGNHAMRWEGSVLDTNQYDFVILQDQSQIPSFPFSNAEFIASRDGAIVLDERVEATGAETIFFLTWGHRLGDQRNPWLSPDYLSMQIRLETGYQEYARSITDEEASRTPYIAPVGLAFQKIYDDIIKEGGEPTDEGTLFTSLYTGDNSHPSKLGTYLAACVMFSTITGESTMYMADDNLGIAESTRLQLQQAADFVVFDSSLSYSYPWENLGPTSIPIKSPTSSPLVQPSESPSSPPSKSPTDSPSRLPSESPSSAPSQSSFVLPSGSPSTKASDSPSTLIESKPSESPSTAPSQSSGSPSTKASDSPSATISGSPSLPPSESPSASPSGLPSIFIVSKPSEVPVSSIIEASGTTRTSSIHQVVLFAGISLLIRLLG